MDWMQCLTIIVTVVGGCFLLHKDHKEDMKIAKEDINAIREDMRLNISAIREEIHLNVNAIREDMRLSEAKWERLFSLFVEQIRKK